MPPQPSQNFLYPTRRRRPGSWPYRCGRPSRPLPPLPSAPDSKKRPSRSSRLRPLRQCEYPGHSLDVSRNGWGQGTRALHRSSHLKRQLSRQTPLQPLPDSLSGRRRLGCSRVHPRFPTLQSLRRYRGRGRSQTADGLWISCPDDVLARGGDPDD